MDKELLEILACPKCLGRLELLKEDGVEKGLVCHACAVVYPIRDSIPIMLVEEAQPLSAQPESPTPPCACS